MCSKPAFVTKAVRAPLRSRSAFVAIVVPCVKRSTSSAATASAAATTDSCCSLAVGTFATRTSPSETSTASVNVPPTSTPSTRMRAFDHAARGRVRFGVHRLVCLGLSHRPAPVELRERIGSLGFGAERCPAVLEHAVLQTCYRVELYARLTSGVVDARDELVDVLSSTHDVPDELLLQHLYVHAGEDVARHLCRVASGLDSLVLGEAEILGQVGDAYARARADDTAGPGIELLFRTAIAAGRRARSETAIGANPATASSMALALAEGVLGEL